MKETRRMKGWSGLTIAALLVLSMAAPALANEEMHPGGRLFYPLWDISGARTTFIIVTRLAQFTSETGSVGQVPSGSTYSANNNCKPGHTAGFPTNPTSTTGPATAVDDVHLEWYGKNCNFRNEIIHMSCGDIDLIYLSSANRTTHLATAITENEGAAEVHFIVNGTNDAKQRINENSLLGHAVIVDLTQGWALTYPAAAAKSTHCSVCDTWEGGTATEVGYEPYPTEVFLPFALTDGSQSNLSNLLSLWGPAFFPGAIIPNTMTISWDWYDGRERKFSKSIGGHTIVSRLVDIDDRFTVSNFVCGHATATQAENDGWSRTGATAETCTTPAVSDTTHPSDEADAAINLSSTPIGWWDFNKTADDAGNFQGGGAGIQQTRGLVGVVQTTAGGTPPNVGDATRLWHKDPCEPGPRGDIGPPHLRDRFVSRNAMVLFNTPVYTGGNSQRLAVCRGTQSAPIDN